MTLLEVATSERDEVVEIAVRGELDLSTVDKLEEELKRLERGRPAVIVLDLSELEFLDSTGLRLIVTADQRARTEGRRLAVVKGPETVQRVFTITRLDERLEMVDRAADVTAA